MRRTQTQLYDNDFDMHVVVCEMERRQRKSIDFSETLPWHNHTLTTNRPKHVTWDFSNEVGVGCIEERPCVEARFSTTGKHILHLRREVRLALPPTQGGDILQTWLHCITRAHR